MHFTIRAVAGGEHLILEVRVGFQIQENGHDGKMTIFGSRMKRSTSILKIQKKKKTDNALNIVLRTGLFFTNEHCTIPILKSVKN